MAQRRKARKKPREEFVSYVASFADSTSWTATAHASTRKDRDGEHRSEHLSLAMSGELIFSYSKKVEKGMPFTLELVNVRDEDRSTIVMGLLNKQHDKLHAMVWVTQPVLQFVLTLLATGKLAGWDVTGNDLRYRSALLRSFSVLPQYELDEYLLESD